MPTRPARAAALVTALEDSASPTGRWLPLLFGWILLRNLIEGFLEVPHELGFDWREEISFAMVFLHFPYFYLALFFGLVLGLHGLTRRAIGRLAGVVATGFGLLLVAPVIDALVSGGRGYDLRYMFGLGSILWRFWDPAASVTAISPGQRVEILLGCMLIAAYVYVLRRQAGDQRGKGVVLALVGAAGLFLWAAFLGAWPSLFARATVPSASGFESAYQAVFRESGLIASEARRHALVLLLPLFLLMPPFFWRAQPDRCLHVWRGIAWSRLFHYSGLALAGVYLGWLQYREFLPSAFHNPTDWLAAVTLWIAMVCAFLAALLWNDQHDLEGDRINQCTRPLATGLLSATQTARIGLTCAAAAALLALTVSYHALLVISGILFLAWGYSAPPLRLKRWPGIATLTLAVLSIASAAAGFTLFAQEMTPVVFPRRIAGLLLVAIALGFTAKDLKDRRGDAQTGVITLATLLPERTARIVAALLVGSAYLIVPLLLPLGMIFIAVAAVFALVSILLTLKIERPDGPLLLTFLLFALIALAFLTVQPELLVPADAAFHAHLRVVEEELRLGQFFDEGRPSPRALVELRRALARLPAAWAASGGGAAIPAWGERCDWLHLCLAGALAPAASLEKRALRKASERLLIRQPLNPSYWDAYFAAACQDRIDEPPPAICDQALARGIRPGDFHRNRAALAIAATERCETDLRAALRFGQRRPLVWTLIGDHWSGRGKPDRALAAYHRALDCDPRLADAWAGLGVTLHAQGRSEDARAALERARELAPRDPWVRNNLGVILREAGHLAAARECFRTAQALAPELFEPPFNLGITCERMGDCEAARRWLRAARRLRPGFAPVEDALRRVEGVSP